MEIRPVTTSCPEPSLDLILCELQFHYVVIDHNLQVTLVAEPRQTPHPGPQRWLDHIRELRNEGRSQYRELALYATGLTASPVHRDGVRTAIQGHYVEVMEPMFLFLGEFYGKEEQVKRLVFPLQPLLA